MYSTNLIKIIVGSDRLLSISRNV